MKRVVAFLLAVLFISGFSLADNTWVCPSCGEENTGAYCGNCGAKSTEWTCSKCGSRNTKNFCTHCGAPKGEPIAGTPQGPNLSVDTPKKVNVHSGDIITFGHYPQTRAGNDNTPIEWQVLDVVGTKAFIISKYVLDARERNDLFATWAESPLRAWLNGEFFNKAFTSTEKRAILTTTINNDNSYYGLLASEINDPSTEDKIFLLSADEANEYFGVVDGSETIITELFCNKGKNVNMKAVTEPTPYAISQGDRIRLCDHKLNKYERERAEENNYYYACPWILLSGWFNYNQDYLRIWWDNITADGYLGDMGIDGHINSTYDSYKEWRKRKDLCIRPALWVDLTKIKF